MFQNWERFGDWALLGVLVIASLVAMGSRNEPMLLGLRARALEVTGTVEGTFAVAGRYLRALDENAVLREENIRLSSEVARSREALIQNEQLRSLLALPDSVFGPRLAARVVSKDITRERNTIVIDVGRRDSVEIDMAVVVPSGIVGRVSLVGERYSLVMTYLNTGFFVPAKIRPHMSDGIVHWSGEARDRLELEHVMKTEPVVDGQEVVTSGYSSVFRAGLKIGVVEGVTPRAGQPSWQIFVRPHAPIDQIEHVFVLLEKADPERIQIQTPPE